MRVDLQLGPDLDVRKRTEVGKIKEWMFRTNMSAIPRIGEIVSCEMPQGYTLGVVRGRVKDVGYFTRTGFWRLFRRPAVTVVLAAV